MLSIKDLQVQYVTDEAGEKTAVILSIEDFLELLEDLEDLARAAERRDESTIPHDEVVSKLREDGRL